MTTDGDPLSGRWTRLDLVDLASLVRFADGLLGDESAHRWPLKGVHNSVESVADELLGLPDPKFVVRTRSGTEPLGLALLVGLDRRSGWCQAGLVLRSGAWRLGWPIEGMLLFVHHLFEVEGLRKIYLDTPSSALDRFGSLVGNWVQEEGVLREHHYVDGCFQDIHLLSITRDRWHQIRAEVPTLAGGHAGPPAR